MIFPISFTLFNSPSHLISHLSVKKWYLFYASIISFRCQRNRLVSNICLVSKLSVLLLWKVYLLPRLILHYIHAQFFFFIFTILCRRMIPYLVVHVCNSYIVHKQDWQSLKTAFYCSPEKILVRILKYCQLWSRAETDISSK